MYGESPMVDIRLKSDNFLDTIRVDARLSTTCGVNIGSAPAPGANTRAVENGKRPKTQVMHPYL